jgi:hypothetical protein
MKRRGLLLTMTEPPPAMEEEFNAWYDDEHMAERLAIPGFRSAQRWVADSPPGEGKYLATYELDSLEVLSSAAYLARFQNQTPWSRRCLGKSVVFRRWACEQLEPGDADPLAAARALALVCSDRSTRGLALDGALQVRHFTATAGDCIALFELAFHSKLVRPSEWPSAIHPLLYRAYPDGA